MLSRTINALFLALMVVTASSYAEDKYTVSDLWKLHINGMNDRRNSVAAILRQHTGANLRGDLTDIGNMQRLLDNRLVNPKDVAMMQAMGVALGDVIANELGMHWVIYEDKIGKSKALQYRDSQHFLFPVTMLSRRGAGGAPINIQALYDKAAKKMEPYIMSGPFMYYEKE